MLGFCPSAKLKYVPFDVRRTLENEIWILERFSIVHWVVHHILCEKCSYSKTLENTLHYRIMFDSSMQKLNLNFFLHQSGLESFVSTTCNFGIISGL